MDTGGRIIWAGKADILLINKTALDDGAQAAHNSASLVYKE